MSAAEERRNERARREGWSSRAQQRQAKALGYSDPRAYREAKSDARAARIPVQANPAALRSPRVLASGVVKATAPAANRRLGVKATRAGTVYGGKGAGQVAAMGKVLGQIKGSKRVAISIGGGAPLGSRGRGFSAAFIREKWNEWREENPDGDFGDFLDDLATEFGYEEGGAGAGAGSYVSMTIV